MADIWNSETFTWVILPLLIFCARIVDVSIGTLRIVFIARNQRIYAPLLGFFEILIWLLAIGQIFQHMDNFACYLAYAGGFAVGNFIGMMIENKLAIGQLIVRIITQSNEHDLYDHIKSAGYGVTRINGEGASGPVKILFTVIERKQLRNIILLINQFTPKAFYTVEDVQMARAGLFPVIPPYRKSYYWRMFKLDRRRK
jgi:uncharacterized protein YebE (UPF0316 family)